MSLAGTKLAMTTAYHPQADGQSERTNRTVEATLRIMVLESGVRWVNLLPTVEFAHNSCVNLTTGKFPSDLLYGYSPVNFGGMARAQANQKRYFDQKHSPISFLPGDLACLRFTGVG